MTTASVPGLAAQAVGTSLRGASTLAALLDALAAGYADRRAVTDAAGTLTFSELRTQAFRLAQAFYADGVVRGDTIGVLMGNRTEWVISCFAAQYLGATVVALNTWYTGRELAYALQHADIRILVMARTFLRSDYAATLDTLRPWHIEMPALRRVVVLSGASSDGTIGWAEYLQSGDGVPHDAITTAQAAVTPEDIAFLLYTSGSMARPKGVRLAHWALLRNCHDIGERQHLTDLDVLLLPISLFWGFGCSNGMMAALTHATHLVLQEHFDAEQAVDLIERLSCTAIYGTANIMQAILEVPNLANRRVGTLRKGLTFGPPALMADVIDRLAPDICHIYGFTEGYGNSAVTDAADPREKRLRTTGRVLPGSELRIVDPATGTSVPSGQEGEICIRGCITPGYHKDEVATAAAFDSAGFYHTGDLGALDEDGFLLFRGRLKEMIKTGGMNVSPAEVEEVLRAHPSVADAFVTGLPDPTREEIVAALVVLAPGIGSVPEELAGFCRTYLSAFKVPRRIKAIKAEDLPLTTTRKVHRARLSELFSL